MIFRRKKEERKEIRRIPVEIVLDLRSRGLGDDRIIDHLRSQGYSFAEISEALAQADVKQAATVMPELAPTPIPEEEKKAEDVERLLEQIVEEKWKEVEERVKVVEEWKKEIDSAISQLNEQVKGAIERLNKLEASMAEQIGKVGKGMEEVGIELRALEKVMSKLVPNMAESIRELKEVVAGLKKRSTS